MITNGLLRSALFALAAVAAISVTACSAPVGDEETDESSAAATKTVIIGGDIGTCERGLGPASNKLICTVCTTGPFPSCTNHTCDLDGTNCKPIPKRVVVGGIIRNPGGSVLAPSP